MHFTTQKISLAIVLLFSITTTAIANPATLADRMDQREAAKRDYQDSTRRSNEDMVRLKKKSKALEKIELPQEENAFHIKEFVLDGDDAEYFPWAQKYLSKYNNSDIGMQGVNLLAKKLSEALTDKGFVTSRVYLREQDISSGILKITIMAGKVRSIRFKEELWGTWRNAFPILPGKILNIRDIEQGLEQMRRVPSQDIDIDIQPAEEAGQSDLVISVKRKKPWRLVFTVDDSGTKPTGKYQFTTALGLDNMLGLNDMLYVSYNEDAMREGEKKGTRADSLYYSIPLGRQTFSINYSRNKYHQTVETAVFPMQYSGDSTYTQFTMTHLLQRDQKGKTDFELGIIKKSRRSYIDKTEISVQRQDTAALRLGILHKKYIGQSVLDVALKYQRGISGFGAVPGVTDHMPGSPTTRYNMFLFDANLNAPFKLATLKGRYSVNVRGQFTRTNLYGSEFFSIAGRYTVRGFDGEQSLSAEKGFVVRQELAFPIIKNTHQLYTAFDYGRVSGPSTKYLLGKEISGAAIGIRGGYKHVQYDAFVAWPVKKPDGFQTEKQTFGFYITTQF